MASNFDKRNNIIHRGENATQDEARAALAVARTIVEIMNGIPVGAAPAPGAAGGG